MSIIKFRKVHELFPNHKVRTVRTEQLCRQDWIDSVETRQTEIDRLAPSPTLWNFRGIGNRHVLNAQSRCRLKFHKID